MKVPYFYLKMDNKEFFQAGNLASPTGSYNDILIRDREQGISINSSSYPEIKSDTLFMNGFDYTKSFRIIRSYRHLDKFIKLLKQYNEVK